MSIDLSEDSLIVSLVCVYTFLCGISKPITVTVLRGLNSQDCREILAIQSLMDRYPVVDIYQKFFS